jgi:hypothetical protein
VKADRHDQAAELHEAAAERHDQAATRWTDEGDLEIAELERGNAGVERERAELFRRRGR